MFRRQIRPPETRKICNLHLPDCSFLDALECEARWKAMRHRKAKGALAIDSAHRKALLRNLTVALLRHEKVVTTEPKAKAVRRLVEKVITLAKVETLHARRQVLKHLQDAEMTAKLFKQLNARFSDRNGGYTRIYKFGHRKGDGSPLAIIELCDFGVASELEKKEKSADESAKKQAEKLKTGSPGRKPAKGPGKGAVKGADKETPRAEKKKAGKKAKAKE